jgi:hypothetical protein
LCTALMGSVSNNVHQALAAIGIALDLFRIIPARREGAGV